NGHQVAHEGTGQRVVRSNNDARDGAIVQRPFAALDENIARLAAQRQRIQVSLRDGKEYQPAGEVVGGMVLREQLPEPSIPDYQPPELAAVLQHGMLQHVPDHNRPQGEGGEGSHQVPSIQHGKMIGQPGNVEDGGDYAAGDGKGNERPCGHLVGFHPPVDVIEISKIKAECRDADNRSDDTDRNGRQIIDAIPQSKIVNELNNGVKHYNVVNEQYEAETEVVT